MSEKTEKKTATAAPASEDEGFLSSWLGKFTTIMIIVWALPTDKIFSQAIKPGWQNLKVRMGDGWETTENLFTGFRGWIARHARSLRITQILILSISIIMLALGLEFGKHSLIVFGGLLLALDLLFIWVLIKSLAHVAVSAVNAGLLALDSTVLGLFRKVGLARKSDDRFQVSHSDVNEVLAKGFVALPVALEAVFVLGLIPSWSSLLLFGLAGLGCLAISLISLHIGDSTVNGWRLASRANKFFIIALCLIAFLIFFLPNSFGKIADPGALDAWLVNWIDNPTGYYISFGFWGTVLSILAIGTVAWILAGLIKGKVGERLTFGILVATLIGMVVGGYSKWGSSSDQVASHSEATQSQMSNYQPRPSFPSSPPSSGSANDMKMPQVDYKSGGSEPTQGNAKLTQSPSTKVVVPKVTITKKSDGLDTLRQNNAEIEALLGI